MVWAILARAVQSDIDCLGAVIDMSLSKGGEWCRSSPRHNPSGWPDSMPQTSTCEKARRYYIDRVPAPYPLAGAGRWRQGDGNTRDNAVFMVMAHRMGVADGRELILWSTRGRKASGDPERTPHSITVMINVIAGIVLDDMGKRFCTSRGIIIVFPLHGDSRICCG